MGPSAIWNKVLSILVWQTNVKIALLVTSHCALCRKIYSLFVGMQVLCQLKGWDRGPHSDNSSVSEPHTRNVDVSEPHTRNM